MILPEIGATAGGGPMLFGQCPNEQLYFFGGASLTPPLFVSLAPFIARMNYSVFHKTRSLLQKGAIPSLHKKIEKKEEKKQEKKKKRKEI